jgi:hypothetical protein
VIGPTVDALAELAPDLIVPAHCTGWDASRAIAGRLPDAFMQNRVGTRLELVSPDLLSSTPPLGFALRDSQVLGRLLRQHPAHLHDLRLFDAWCADRGPRLPEMGRV